MSTEDRKNRKSRVLQEIDLNAPESAQPVKETSEQRAAREAAQNAAFVAKQAAERERERLAMKEAREKRVQQEALDAKAAEARGEKPQKIPIGKLLSASKPRDDKRVKAKEAELGKIQKELAPLNTDLVILREEVARFEGVLAKQETDIKQYEANQQKIKALTKDIGGMLSTLTSANNPIVAPLPQPSGGPGIPPPPPPPPPPPGGMPPPVVPNQGGGFSAALGAKKLHKATISDRKKDKENIDPKSQLLAAIKGGTALKKHQASSEQQELTQEEVIQKLLTHLDKKIVRETEQKTKNLTLIKKKKEKLDSLREKERSNELKHHLGENTVDGKNIMLEEQASVIKVLEQKKELLTSAIETLERKKEEGREAEKAVKTESTLEAPLPPMNAPPPPPPAPPPPPLAPPPPPLAASAAKGPSKKGSSVAAKKPAARGKKIAVDTKQAMLAGIKERGRINQVKNFKKKILETLENKKNPEHALLQGILEKEKLGSPTAENFNALPDSTQEKIALDYGKQLALLEDKLLREATKAAQEAEAANAKAKTEQRAQNLGAIVARLDGYKPLAEIPDGSGKAALKALQGENQSILGRFNEISEDYLASLLKEIAEKQEVKAIVAPGALPETDPEGSLSSSTGSLVAATDAPTDPLSDDERPPAHPTTVANLPAVDPIGSELSDEESRRQSQLPAHPEEVLAKRLSAASIELEEERSRRTSTAIPSTPKPRIIDTSNSPKHKSELNALKKNLLEKYVPKRSLKVINTMRNRLGGVDRKEKVKLAENIVREIEKYTHGSLSDDYIKGYLIHALKHDFDLNQQGISKKQGILSTMVLETLDKVEPSFSSSDKNPWNKSKVQKDTDTATDKDAQGRGKKI